MPALAMPLLAGWLAACGEPAEPPEPVEPAPDAAPSGDAAAAAEKPSAPAVRAVVGSGEGTSVALAFDGVGALHRRWFSDDTYLGPLGTALGACISGEATVRLRWDDEVRIGHITVEVDPSQLTCRPTPGAEGLDLAPLEPIGRALAAYRDGIAAAFDFRVASFRGELRLLGEGEGCLLRIGGQYPPDGSRWHACVELDGREVCAPDAADQGVVALKLPSPADQGALRACLAD